MLAHLLAAFLSVPATALMVYFAERVWLLIRAKEERLNAVLDRDLYCGQQLWLSLKGLFVPPELF